MSRALQNAPYTASTTLYTGSIETDPSPDLATIEVVRDDGTAMVPAGTSTTGSGTGKFLYTFAAAQLATLDHLELRWTMTVNGAAAVTKTYVEVVGGFLCPLADLKAIWGDIGDEILSDRRTAVERELEKACGVAFVPRYAKDELTPRRGRARLKRGWVRSIRSLTAQALVWTPTQISYLDVDWETGKLAGLPYSLLRRDVVVTYEHGADYADEIVRDATLTAAKEMFGSSSEGAMDGRIVRRAAGNVAVTYASPSSSSDTRFVTPALRSFIKSHRMPMSR